MRVLRPKQKEVRRVLIPSELRSSLGSVSELIQLSANDPDIILDFDDAIQVDWICGGRYGKTNRPYVLTYYPTGDSERGRWFLTLHQLEIEDIGDGCQTELLLHCCISNDCRSKFREPHDYCSYCDYEDDPRYGTFSFSNALQELRDRGIPSLTEASTRQDVAALLGNPDRSGGGVNSEVLGFIRPWLTYRRADCQLRFEFDTHDHILTLTVLPPDWKPDK